MDKPRTGGTSTVLVASGKLQETTNFADGAECYQEFDVKTGATLLRRWKFPGVLGATKDWVYEIGEAPTRGGGAGGPAGGAGLISASSRSPIFVPCEVPEAWQFRIRNLPYPAETYKLSVDEEKQEVVLRTTNKKYYKRMSVPALKRREMPLDARMLSCEYTTGTLLISYKKPPPVLLAEQEERAARMDKARASKEGDVDCKTQ